MKKSNLISIIAAAVLLLGITVMLFLTPGKSQETEPAHTQMPTESVPAVSEDLPVESTTELPTLPPTEPPTEPPTDPPVETVPPTEWALTCKHAFVYDLDSGYPLYLGGDSAERLAPASLTKLATARTALACMDPDTVVTVGEEVTWIDPESSVAWLAPGHKLTVKMLVQGLIMQSGNDAAYALAVAGGRAITGDETMDRRQAYNVFIDEMNKNVRELGLKNTHFMNPDGIDQEGHYTTVEDLIVLSRAYMADPLLMEYAGTASADVEFVSGETCTWLNSNYLLQESTTYYTPDAIGLKTGSTSQAGKCLISVFQPEDGRNLIIGVLGCPLDEDRYVDTLKLYEMYKDKES